MNLFFIVISLCICNVFCNFKGDRKSGCTGHSFECKNGGCIPSTSVCDGAVNCGDGSDETPFLCEDYIKCPPYTFRCGYGACVDKFRTCDKNRDCADNSDEVLPDCFNSSSIVNKCKSATFSVSTSVSASVMTSIFQNNKWENTSQSHSSSTPIRSYEFQCDNGQCIDEFSVCDGKSDCVDGSDESMTQCITFGCPDYGFRCGYGGCINMIKKCDQIKDCKDGSDEDPELCRSNIIEETSTTEKPKTEWSGSESSESRGGCRLPGKPDNGDYEVNGCSKYYRTSKCTKVPGTIVNSYTVLNYSCNEGYVFLKKNVPVICEKGMWKPKPQSCLRPCEGLYYHSLKLTCYDGDTKVDCGQPVRPNTELKAECKDSYHYHPDTPIPTLRCLTNGNWDKQLFECYHDCGNKNEGGIIRPLLKNATIVKPSEFPWHAGLYLGYKEIPDYVCGGTIIHPKAILTAAHCVYDEDLKRTIDKHKLHVAVGKHWSKWDHKNDAATKQLFGVEEIIIIVDYYKGKLYNFDYDIAILDLKRPIELNRFVLPVCFDKTNTIILDRNIEVGTVVASGQTGKGTPVSEELRAANLTIINYLSCVEKTNNSGSITHDKFCTQSYNGPTVQEGDSGSGLTFPRFISNRVKHFILGIVSLWPLKTNDDIAAFTDVTMHVKWISEVLDGIDKKMKNQRYEYITA